MRSNKIGRTTALALTLCCALAPAAFAQEGSVAEQTVDSMNRLWGAHAGLRSNHTKGIVVEGSFAPGPAGAGLSKAALFAGPAMPVTVRFSNATGIPTLPDGDPNANPHGMAIRFHLASGEEVDIVANSLKFFPVADGEQFRDLLQAVVESGPGAAKPTKLDSFVAAHPSVPGSTVGVATPVSFARETYNGIDAFVFVDAAGKRQPFRFQISPAEGAAHLSAADAAKAAPDFLRDELRQRLGKEPVRFQLRAQLAEPGDQTKDPSQPWPESRPFADLGTITIDKTVADNAATEKELLFLPANLTDGIEASDDPLIDARNEAYAVSFGRRSQ